MFRLAFSTLAWCYMGFSAVARKEVQDRVVATAAATLLLAPIYDSFWELVR